MGLFGRDTKLDREAVFEQLKIDEGVVNEITGPNAYPNIWCH